MITWLLIYLSIGVLFASFMVSQCGANKDALTISVIIWSWWLIIIIIMYWGAIGYDPNDKTDSD